MIKRIHFILAMFVVGSLSAQSIPDGTFEQWDSVIWQEPVGYNTSNTGNNLPAGAPVNVTRVAGYHASYGIQLSTINYGGNLYFAYIANSAGNPLQGQGGIPYNQKPTGMRLYYKCNVIAGDSAGIMAVFKKAGSIIGTYYYTFTGTTASYTLFSKTFSPALPSTPDTVIFAATSSNVIFGGAGAAGSTLTIDSLNFTSVASQPAQLNGDFELWQADSMYTPSGWYTQGKVKRTTDKYTGKYAAELITSAPPGKNNIQSSLITDGRDVQINSNHDSIIPAYAYSGIIDTLVFYYKYTPAVSSDSANVNMQFSKNAVIVGGAGMQLAASAVYKKVAVPFNNFSVSDSAIVSFQSSKWPTQSQYIGSDLKIDDAYFTSQGPVGISQVKSNNEKIKIYPNPVSSLVYINTEGYTGRVNKITMYDLTGKAVVMKNYAFGGLKNTVEAIDMSNYNPGIYIIKLDTDKGVQYQKISKVQ